MKTIQYLILIYALLIPPIATSKALTPEQVPEPLKPWVNWVLQDSPEANCPFIYNSYGQKRCSWPTLLSLELSKRQGAFFANWQVYQDSWISLPGDSQHWPQNVTVNNKTALVLEKNGIPTIKLDAGFYQIKGDFFWDSLPDNLGVPQDTGLVNLKINGNSITIPTLKNGQLWLKSSDSGQVKAQTLENTLDLQVFRKIIDEVPTQVLTHLVLNVSGDQREVKLAMPLLQGFIPMQIQSPIPARLEPDGQLLVQVRPGLWQIDILARASQDFPALTLNPQENWPEAEIWSFEARPDLRVVEIEQANAIDPSLSNLPDDWKNLPAYRVNLGQTIHFNVIHRGDPEPEPNQLNLTRKLWLDFDGNGYTVNDHIEGRMSRDWRLNVLPQTQLGRATLNGDNQLITTQGENQQIGIEVRHGVINLDADSRIPGDISPISATGWQQNFQRVNTELNLPPGWRLFAVNGVDNVPDTWLSQWTLLDLFLVLIAALATGRLWHVQWGVFALATLALSWHEPNSPQLIWLNLLAATALIKVLPEGKFSLGVQWYRKLCWLALVLMVIPFMVSQVRFGLYPQLEYPSAASYPVEPQLVASEELDSTAASPEANMDEAQLRKAMPAQKPASLAFGVMTDEAVNFNRIDPKAKVQTGPGLPQWQWRKIQLSWNGAVDGQQQLQLWLSPPTLTLVLNIVRVISIVVLALLMFGLSHKLKLPFKSMPTALLITLLVPVMLGTSNKVWADIPEQSVLDQLRERLQQAPDCLPECAQISQMQLSINEHDLSINLQIHAQEDLIVPLPAQYEQWLPSQVLVDGEAALGLYRNEQGLWLKLSPGQHQVSLQGMTPGLAKFTLPLPLKPHRLTFDSKGWLIDGTLENALADNQIQFNRLSPASQNANKVLVEPSQLPPFVTVERILQLGLDWHVTTRIHRLTSADVPILLNIPLLAGEAVTSPGIPVKEGKAIISMASQETRVEWQSSLEKSEHIVLTAAPTQQWIETWRADISPIWHMESTGLAMMHLSNPGLWLPEWHPWPGEQVSLQITRPAAISGQNLTIDDSWLTLKPGLRVQDAVLKLTLRSSQGAQHTISIPEQAQLQSVSIDGINQPIRQQGHQVTLPIKPGTQTILLNWQLASSLSTLLSSAKIDLGLDSVNSHLNVQLGEDRWVLFAFGPKFGPAVLFWGVLIVIIILAIGLGKIHLTPLKSWHWGLLLVGLSQITLPTAFIVIAWLILLGWRGSHTLSKDIYFNALQVLLALLTLMSLGFLFSAVEQGLLGSPQMQIDGNQSTHNNLNWYQDRSGSILPSATVISVPLMVYRLLMLAWSLWLAAALLNWLKWGWACFASDSLWKKAEPTEAEPTSASQAPEQKNP
ncbi:MAG: hypothetical protein WC782_15625 [Methylococcaceae bacterium]|jgi:hypothetical protein